MQKRPTERIKEEFAKLSNVRLTEIVVSWETDDAYVAEASIEVEKDEG